MEKKTDLFLEYGQRKSDPETHQPRESQTDRAMEYNLPTDTSRQEYYCAADRNKEHCRQEDSAQRIGARREHRRRGLLLQMACIALSVVVVTNAFDLDILGGDVFFDENPNISEPVPEPSADTPDVPDSPDPPVQSDPVPPEDQHPSPEGIAEPPSLYVIPHNSDTPVFIVSGGQQTLEGLGLSGLSYDPDTNTLTLDDFWGHSICANRMGEDFTIYLKGENDVNSIISYGDSASGDGSLTLDGDFHAELNINPNKVEPVGIHIFADGGRSVLRVEPGIDLAVSGDEAAILVTDTSAEVGIVTVPCTMISGDVTALHSGAVAETVEWSFTEPEMPMHPMERVTFRMAFSMDYLSIRMIHSPVTLYQGHVTNYLLSTYEYPSYNSVQQGTEFTVRNTSSQSPIYVYFVKYTKHSEPFLIPWEETPEAGVQEIDMQGKYYGAGVTYLATDGTDLYWVDEVSINGAELPGDAVRLYPGESITFSLPHDGSDSIYRLYTEVYYPELDHRYWIHSTIKVMN